jgi:hypothetical protein
VKHHWYITGLFTLSLNTLSVFSDKISSRDTDQWCFRLHVFLHLIHVFLFDAKNLIARIRFEIWTSLPIRELKESKLFFYFKLTADWDDCFHTIAYFSPYTWFTSRQSPLLSSPILSVLELDLDHEQTTRIDESSRFLFCKFCFEICSWFGEAVVPRYQFPGRKFLL